MAKNSTKTKTQDELPSKDRALRNEIVVALVAASVTALLSQILWFYQFNANYTSEIKQAKIALIEKVTETTIRYSYLSPFKLRMTGEGVQIKNRLVQRYGKYSSEFELDAEDSLMATFPFEYKKMLEADDYFPHMMSTLVAAQLFYGDEVRVIVDSLVSEFDIISKLREEIGTSVSKDGENPIFNALTNDQQLYRKVMKHNEKTERLVKQLIVRMGRELK